MKNKYVYCMYFNGIFDIDISKEDEQYYSKSETYNYRNRFKEKFLKLIKKDKDNYYYFILSDTQIPEFENHVEKYKLSKYIVAERRGVCNQNYRFKNHPRMNWFLFNFTEDFQVE